MSGHSKWHSIKHKKAITDAKRGKILTKHSKILTVAARNDPNPDTNATLRTVIANAKADGVPKDNIERILKKATGIDKDKTVFSEQIYEGFGPHGVPFIVLALTDNVNRTFPSVRTAFAKNGGTLGASGSVSFMFDHIGVILVKNNGTSEDEIFEAVTEAGADDFQYNQEETEVYTQFIDLAKVRDSLINQGFEVIKAEPLYQAKNPKILSGKELESIEKFIEAVEEAEDVDAVFGGFDVESE